MGPVGIEQYKNNINIFPNPSNGIFHLDEEVSSVEVFDNLGRSLLLDNKNEINLTEFGPGVYYAKVQVANGPATVVKLIVQ